MRERRLFVALGAGLCLALGGCFASGTALPFLREAPPPSPPTPAPAPLTQTRDLRIPDQGASRPDIPLVPVPLPPLGRPAAPASSSGAPGGDVRPVSYITPSAPEPAKTPGTPAPSAPAPTPAPAPPASPATASPTPPTGAGLPPLTPKQLYEQAAARYAGIDSYIARLTRREVVRDKAQPEEVMLFKFRKEPWSVHFKWLGKEGEGREVIHVHGQYENKIHTLLASGDIPFVAAGKRMSFALDNTLVRSASRHPITEAGMGASIERFGRLLAALEKGDRRLGTVTNLGPRNRPDYPRTLYLLEHAVPPGAEEALPKGGRRLYGFDPVSNLPVLIQTYEGDREVEYYRYDRVQFPVRLDNDDFNPDKLWAKPAATASAAAR